MSSLLQIRERRMEKIHADKNLGNRLKGQKNKKGEDTNFKVFYFNNNN